jgi:formate hydrogenlyase subunit 3/multisubunit Na+/H+ antiporter MnhD subunit
VSKQRIAINNFIGALATLVVAFIIHRTAENPALRYLSDVMFPIGAVTMILAAIFFLVARDIDGPPMER